MIKIFVFKIIFLLVLLSHQIVNANDVGNMSSISEAAGNSAQAAADQLAEDAGAVVLQHKKNQGYGAAITTLFDYCRKENVDVMVTIDGDGQHNAKEIPVLLNAITNHNVDVAIGTRSFNDSNSPNYRNKGIKIITLFIFDVF